MIGIWGIPKFIWCIGLIAFENFDWDWDNFKFGNGGS